MENNDSFTEVTSQSWLSRLAGAFKGILFGIVLVFGSIYLLWWNEGRAVQTAKSLEEGSATVVSIDNNEVKAENEGALVHLTGNATTQEILKDQLFDVSVNGVKLKRNVQMYQWKEETETEKKKKVGGSEETITTYNYHKTWSSTPINSGNFKRPEGHSNPSFKYRARSQQATDVNIGAFKLSSGLISQMNSYKSLPVEKVDTTKVPNAKLEGSTVYIGNNQGSPQVGDMKVSFQVVQPSDVSIVARQVKNTFEPYQTEAGDALSMLAMGTVSSENMFTSAQESNNTMTWILRIVGFVLMSMGFGMILKPISVIGDLIPFIGNLLEVGTGLISGIASFSISFVTIALAWVFYRPVIGISLLVIGGAAVIFAIKKANDKKKLKEANKVSQEEPASVA